METSLLLISIILASRTKENAKENANENGIKYTSLLVCPQCFPYMAVADTTCNINLSHLSMECFYWSV